MKGKIQNTPFIPSLSLISFQIPNRLDGHFSLATKTYFQYFSVLMLYLLNLQTIHRHGRIYMSFKPQDYLACCVLCVLCCVFTFSVVDISQSLYNLKPNKTNNHKSVFLKRQFTMCVDAILSALRHAACAIPELQVTTIDQEEAMASKTSATCNTFP